MDGLLQASGGEEALDETHQSSNFTQTQKEETNAQVEKENVTKRRRIGDYLKTKDPDPEGIKKEKFCSLDEVFSHLTVTSEIVTAFEYVTNYLRAHLQAQMVPLNPQVSSHNTGTKDIPIPAWQLPGIEKVQLGSSGVWVDSGQLKILTTSWRKNPNELARRLFKWLVGEPTLARTSALGGGAKQKQALDPFLRTAVAAYVEDVTGRRIEVNRIVNLMCGKLAVNRRSSSSFDKSADGMSRIKSKKNESPENNKAEINTKDAGVTNEPPILTDLSQAGPNKENLTDLTHPPPAVTPQLYVPEMQQQWGYSHFGYQQTYPPPSPQYANYFNQTGNMHFPTNAPHHQMNYFGSFDQPSDNCEPASPNFYNL